MLDNGGLGDVVTTGRAVTPGDRWMTIAPRRGDFVRVRTRRWLVEDERPIDGLNVLRLACVDDDAQGEVVEVLWDAELDGSILRDEGWGSLAKLGTDGPGVFSAYLLEYGDRGRQRPVSGSV